MKKSLLLFYSVFFCNFIFAQTTAQTRCSNFGLGQNISNWLEAHWQTNYPTPNGYTKASLEKMKEAGIKSLRLPVCFAKITDTIAPFHVDTTHVLFNRIDSVIKWADELDMNVTIDNHHGWDLLTNATWRSQEQRFTHLWAVLAKRYAYLDPERYTFELWNEPNIGFALDSINLLFNEAIDSIRQHAPNHTIIVSPNTGSSGSAYVTAYSPLPDTNLIYTWHFYDPLDFTHQGFPWGNFPSTVATFPSPGLFFNLMNTGLNNVKIWKTNHNEPLILGEFGVGVYANDTSRCNWIGMIGEYIDTNHIPAFYWDWQYDFNMFYSNTVSRDSIIPCFKNALHYYENTSSIAALSADEVSIYPNPILSGEPELRIKGIKNFDYKLSDNTGRLIAKGMKQNDVMKLNLTAGLYFIQLSTEKGFTTKKLVIE